MVHFCMVDNFKLSYLMGCLFNQFKWFFICMCLCTQEHECYSPHVEVIRQLDGFTSPFRPFRSQGLN